MHLQDWPDVSDWNPDPDEQELAGAIDLVRIVCSTALGLRKAHQLRVRLPLASLTIADPAAGSLAPFTGLIAEEVNVKAVELSAEPASLGRFELAVNPRVLGPRLGGQVQQVIRAVKAGSWTQAGDRIEAAGVELEPGEYELKLAAADPDSTSALPGNTGLIALDLRVTRSWRPKARRVTWCGSCSRPAGTPGWWSRTGSGSPSAPTARSRRWSGPTPGSSWPRRSRSA